MIRLIQDTPDCSDATAGYSVELDKEYTVASFAEMLFTEKTEEWGNVNLVVNIEKPYKFDNPGFWYRNGRVDNPEQYQQLINQYGNRKISKVHGHGGWHRFDYTIWMEDSKPKKKAEVKETKQEEQPEEQKDQQYRNNKNNRNKRKEN